MAEIEGAIVRQFPLRDNCIEWQLNSTEWF